MVKKHANLRIIGLIVAVLILMALIVFLVGRSFGFFQYAKKGDVVNIVTINGLTVDIDSTTDQALNLAGAYPMSDNDGLKNDSFTFTITNTSSRAIDYTLKLLNDTDKQEECYVDDQEEVPCTLLPYQYIKYAYSINNGPYSTPANLTSAGNIYSETISGNGNTMVSIKLWIDSTAPNSIQGNAFFGKLVIVGEKSTFAGNLPSNINFGDTYTIARTAMANEVITCVSDKDGTVTNTSTLSVGVHNITCTSSKENGTIYEFTRSIRVFPTAPGLYDSNDNLLASWNVLVNTYGLDVETDFDDNAASSCNTGSCTYTNNSMLGYIINNNPSLQSGTKLIVGNVSKIGDNAFVGSNTLIDIIITDGPTIISNAFDYCANLKSVTLPSTVTDLYHFTFGNLPKLEVIDVSTNNSTYSSIDGVLFDKAGETLLKYPYGKRDTSYTIPDGVVTISNIAAYDNPYLTNLVFASTVNYIESSAFGNCTSLTSITIPSGCHFVSVDDCAFTNTPWYNTASQHGTVPAHFADGFDLDCSGGPGR